MARIARDRQGVEGRIEHSVSGHMAILQKALGSRRQPLAADQMAFIPMFFTEPEVAADFGREDLPQLDLESLGLGENDVVGLRRGLIGR